MLKQLLDRVWTGGTADADLYAVVAQELSSGGMDVGLWTKACADSGGAEAKAKARYIEMRVSVLRNMRRAAVKDADKQQRLIASERALHEKQSHLSSREQAIVERLYDMCESPGAIQLKRRNRRIATTIAVIATPLVYLAFAGFAVVGAAFAITLFLCVPGWLLLLALANADGRPAELRRELSRVRRERGDLR